MAYPTSPTVHGFEVLDLSGLARVTSKTFERLAPYSLIQCPSSPEARQTIKKIINKIQAYIEAIDMSIHAIHITYQMSKIAQALWTNTILFDEKQTLAERTRRQKHSEDFAILADEALKKAQKTTTMFKQVQQEFYKIAALTKDMDCTIEIPVDPTLPELIKKPLKDIGPDLVSNLNLLAEFTHRSSDLTTWCVWIKSSIITADGTVIPPQDGSFADVNTIRPKWDRFRADCLIYHSIISEILDRYDSILSRSSDVWCATMHEMSSNTRTVKDAGRTRGRGPRLPSKVSYLLQDAVRHLSCHTQSNFVV